MGKKNGADPTTDWTTRLEAIDLAGLQPMFPDATRAKDAAVGLADEQAYRRRGRHLASDGSRIRKCRDVLRRLPTLGESIHVLLSGHFRNSDFIPSILDMAGARCDRLSLCTLGYDRKTCDMLIREIDAGRIQRVSMLSCVYHKSHEPDLHAWITDQLAARNSRHLAARVHVKVMAFDLADGRRYTLESSANLRSCNMAELSTVTADAGLTAFHHAWIDHLFAEAQPDGKTPPTTGRS